VRYHASRSELLVGFRRKESGRGGPTYAEAFDEALAYGWIDGVRRGRDAASYTIRFTPRKATSIGSAVNVRHVEWLTREGRMAPAGVAAFAKRAEKRTAIYAYEQRRSAALDSASLKELERDAKARRFYEAQAPWYRRTTAHWVTRAKKPETRARRLATLIECSRRGERIPLLGYAKKRS
jgi:uncharacterized protein YdeI (YjbR/CyaY-like superfamily)